MSVVALSVNGGLLATVCVEPLVESFLGMAAFDNDFAMPPPVPPLELAIHLAAVALSTTLLLGAALAFSIRRAEYVGLWTFFSCLALGWLNAASSLALAAFATVGFTAELPERLLGGVLVGLVFGLFFAAPLGAAYGAVAALATRRLRRLVDRPTLSLQLDAQLTVGLTVFGSAVAASAFAASRGDAVFVPWLAPAALAGLGLVLALGAIVRADRVRRLAKDPTAAGYTRVALEDLGVSAAALWPLHDGVSSQPAHALVQEIATDEGGAYRAARTRVPIALVD